MCADIYVIVALYGKYAVPIAREYKVNLFEKLKGILRNALV